MTKCEKFNLGDNFGLKQAKIFTHCNTFKKVYIKSFNISLKKNLKVLRSIIKTSYWLFKIKKDKKNKIRKFKAQYMIYKHEQILKLS